jgi:beta-glucosidase
MQIGKTIKGWYMRGINLLGAFALFIALVACNRTIEKNNFHDPKLERKVDSILSLMTLEEKIGQMSQLSRVEETTGPVDSKYSYLDAIRQGKLGSMLNVTGTESTRGIQEMVLQESRLGIPMLFGLDVIHGYKTIFPVPLGEACSWDLEAIERSARIAAGEASAAGQHWTFAPMVDIARDPRWGRIMEGAGEDTYLGSLIAAARVRGFQGDDLSAPNTIAACAKHYAAYGAAEGGRDYNTTDMSERTLREIYLPPFKAAVDAGVATFMTAFNEVNGIPASANPMLRYILRNEWHFGGMTVSDWNSISELIPHGFAGNKEEAAILAIRGGVDMDMQGHVYSEVLLKLVEEGKVREEDIDNAVRNILRLKFQLGLFDDPFRYCNEQREAEMILTDNNRLAARNMGRRSIVLLKNENHLLPLSKNLKTLTVIGPLANDSDNILGGWRAMGDPADAVSLLRGIREAVDPKTKILYEKGCDIDTNDRSGFAKAITAAKRADVVILAVGESAVMSGEAHSRSDIGLPGLQPELVKEIYNTGKPVILVLMNGRPLAISWEAGHIPAILETWQAGTEAGHSIADVLFGDYNPSGKLVTSLPRTTGQIPVYYNHKNTGRPPTNERKYNSRYMDLPVGPMFPFGYGLSYTTFFYSDLELSNDTLHMDDTLKITIEVTNNGNYAGEEVVQLYIRDYVGSVTRPVKELKDFQKILLAAGETRIITFNLTSAKLAFYNDRMQYRAEPGDFSVMVGTNSAEYLEEKFVLVR